MKNYVHRLSDPRDPAYPFSDTFICSNCNERLSLESKSCDICNLYIYGEVESVKPTTPSTYPEPEPYNKSFIVDKTNSGSVDVAPPFMVKIISRKNNIWIRTETDSTLPIENILNSSKQDNFSFVKRFELLVNPAKNIDIYWNGQLIPYLESTNYPVKIHLDGITRTVTVKHFVPQS